MKYSGNDIYTYEGTSVLKNNFNIKDQKILDEKEKDIVTRKLIYLVTNPIKEFSITGLKKIHKFLFDEIYPFAGEFRNVNISKGETRFCQSIYIEDQLKDLFSQLINKDNCLKNLSIEDFIDKFSYYFSELNLIHPFREGNGRTMREFFSILALESSFYISFHEITKSELLEACISSYTTDNKLFIELFSKNIIKLNK